MPYSETPTEQLLKRKKTLDDELMFNEFMDDYSIYQSRRRAILDELSAVNRELEKRNIAT